MNKLFLLAAICTLTLLAGCRHRCGERPRLFDRGRDTDGPLERIRDRYNDRNDDCDNCRPVSRTGYPGLGMPVSNTGSMPYLPGGYTVMPGSGNIQGGMPSNDPRMLPNPMPNIPSPGVPEGPAAQPFPAGPSSVLPLPSNGGARPVSNK